MIAFLWLLHHLEMMINKLGDMAVKPHKSMLSSKGGAAQTLLCILQHLRHGVEAFQTWQATWRQKQWLYSLQDAFVSSGPRGTKCD